VVFIPLKTESEDYITAQTLTMKTVKADLKVMYSYISIKTSTARAAHPRDYTRMVYRRRPGSGPAEQRKKKYWNRKSSSATVSDMCSFL
jgi:hypothetical protein